MAKAATAFSFHYLDYGKKKSMILIYNSNLYWH